MPIKQVLDASYLLISIQSHTIHSVEGGRGGGREYPGTFPFYTASKILQGAGRGKGKISHFTLRPKFLRVRIYEQIRLVYAHPEELG